MRRTLLRLAVPRARFASSGSVRPRTGFPKKQGLYDPALEKDSCGVGMVAHLKGQVRMTSIGWHETRVDPRSGPLDGTGRGSCYRARVGAGTPTPPSPPYPTQASHEIVRDANTMLVRMAHRGGCGCEPSSGDGAGMLTGMPHTFLSGAMEAELGVALPPQGEYGAGNIFFPRDASAVAQCKEIIEAQIKRCTCI